MLPPRSQARSPAAGAGVSSGAGASRRELRTRRAATGGEPRRAASPAVRGRLPPRLCPITSGVLGPSEPRELEPGVQHVSTALGGPRAPSPGNGDRSGGRSPGPRRAGRIRGQRRLAPRFLGLPGWGGAGTVKVAVVGRVNASGARLTTHLSRVHRRADPAPALRWSSCGPRRVAGAQPLPWPPESGGDGHRPGLGGDLEPCTRARDSTRSSLRPPPPVPAQLPPAVRPVRGPGTQVPRWRERVGLREPGPSAALAAPWSRRLCGAERSGAERSAHCSLAFRKATLAAGRRDAGLTHARARVNARLWGRERGSDGRRRWRAGVGGQGEGQGLSPGQPPEAPGGRTQTLERCHQGFCLSGMGSQPWAFFVHLSDPSLSPSCMKAVVPPALATCTSMPRFPLLFPLGTRSFHLLSPQDHPLCSASLLACCAVRTSGRA